MLPPRALCWSPPQEGIHEDHTPRRAGGPGGRQLRLAGAGRRLGQVEGYLEFKKGLFLIVDGQRIQTTEKTKLKAGKIKSVADLPLGYGVRASGKREKDGTVVAAQIEARANGSEYMESQVLEGTNQAEQAYRKAKTVGDTGADGKQHAIGA
jgi:hypothetical protein